ncbi:MAG TPA: hypothetical protein PKH31_02315 [Candidatus Sumerlaeota bacterium]|nr:hypothetical protein [Candidatus Sumerlaeota bacterium]
MTSQTPPLPTRKLAPAAEAPGICQLVLETLGCQEVALVRNPSYIYAPLEIYPLPPRITGNLPRLAGVVMDMDGTTTTTEPLCIHSLEWMTRQVTGRTSPSVWAGLDRKADYPHIIGNSTTKHVEYLLVTYGEHFKPADCLRAYLNAALWTLARGRDENRRREVRANTVALGLGALLDDAEFRATTSAGRYVEAEALALADRLAPVLLDGFRAQNLNDRVRAAVDIYYMRYHMILNDIADGHGAEREREVLGTAHGHLIEPMPAIGLFLAALKGRLGAQMGNFAERLIETLRARGIKEKRNCCAGGDAGGTNYNRCAGEDAGGTEPIHGRDARATSGDAQATSDWSDGAGYARRLAALGRYLEAHPVPVAVVTSSIAYEARVVLGAVFGLLREDVAGWPVDDATKAQVLQDFQDPEAFYDAFITASDSSEIRLKPHRDLYSIALQTLGLGHEDFPCVIGFEDSESGVTAIRAAGVGLSVAVPFADTEGHNLEAAARIMPGQLPEVLLGEDCFLDPAALKPFENEG